MVIKTTGETAYALCLVTLNSESMMFWYSLGYEEIEFYSYILGDLSF